MVSLERMQTQEMVLIASCKYAFRKRKIVCIFCPIVIHVLLRTSCGMCAMVRTLLSD